MATWIAGLGALLLLAAATTFLAVRWDALGATARIALVGGVTVAAVLGGDRLRRSLPAVGGVLFHLGALLVPIDALGLMLQFGAPGWARWLAVGITAVVALPLLALLGRAPVLAVAALAGVPVTATGLAMVAGTPPAVLVAACALALVPLVGRAVPEPLAPAATLGSIVLAVAAVLGGVGLELAVALGADGVSATAAAAGWLADWPARAVTALLAVLALSLRARTGDQRILAIALATGTLAILHVVLPPATPRAVRLWTPPMLWLALELAWLAFPRGAGAQRRAAPRGFSLAILTAELLALPAALAVAMLVFQPSRLLAADLVLAGAVGIAAAAWVSVALRLGHHGAGLVASDLDVRPAAPLVAVVAVWHAVVAGLFAGGDPVLLLGGVLLVTALPLVAQVRGRRNDGSLRTTGVDLVAVLLLLAGTEGLTAGSATALLVAVLAPLLVLPLLGPLAARGIEATGLLTVPAAVVLVALVTSMADTGLRVIALPGGLAGVLVGGTALAIAWVSAASRPLALGGRILAGVAGLTTTLPRGVLVPWEISDPVMPGLIPGAGFVSAGALVPSMILGLLLLIDAARHRGPVAATAASLVLLRAVSALALASGVEVEVVGAALLAIGIAAAVTAGVGARSLPRPIVIATSVVAVLVAPVGWLLLGDAGVLRASALLAAGAGSLMVGLVLRRWALAHTGAAIATLGTWSLLLQLSSIALDLFLLPVAVQLALAGAAARRAGDTSSWIAYAPAVALVGIPAVLERVWGGPGWHSLLAGVVGIAAVTLGGAHGLRGPVLLGAALVVTVVVVETLTVVVGVPTWAWLTVGGLTLLAAAAFIERIAQTPGDAARRLAMGLKDRE